MVPPLAERLRPQKLSEIVGQEKIFGNNNFFERMIKSQSIPNMIFYGPPGTGKTTAAQIISKQTDKKFYKINATSASLSDIKNIISQINPITAPTGIFLYIDEIQYFNKKQQQSLLEFMENGKITLIASTTENPYFYIFGAVLSRSQVFEFKRASIAEINKALIRAVNFLEKEQKINIQISEKTLNRISSLAQGDVRRAINTLEICFSACESENNTKVLDDIDILNSLEKNSFTGYNKTGDDHYDLLSAFQKSIRGSDPHASIYYLARLLEAGELLNVCRRLLICVCEDVGLAYPNIIPTIKSLTDIAREVGLPEAKIPLADAVIMAALSPKSNSAYNAINSALEDVKNGKNYDIPRHLKNIHCDSSNTDTLHLKKYLYPHNYENHIVNQQYLPDEIKNKKYYYPQNNKNESAFRQYWEKATKH